MEPRWSSQTVGLLEVFVIDHADISVDAQRHPGPIAGNSTNRDHMDSPFPNIWLQRCVSLLGLALALGIQAKGPNTLAGYGLAKSESDVLITKGIGKCFYDKNGNPPVKNNNVRLVLTLTVQKGNVIIRGRMLDRDDGNKAIFDRTYVDTLAAEMFADGQDNPPAPSPMGSTRSSPPGR